MKKFMIFGVFLFALLNLRAQTTNKVMVGAYYFDGWSNINDKSHLTKALTDTFTERKPVWGWITSTQTIVDTQVKEASQAGLAFFSFCWYYNGKPLDDSLNRAMRLYNKSLYKNQLKYTLLVCNHAGFELGPKEWPVVVNRWIKLLKNVNYLTVNGKPLITFFTVTTLIKKFGSPANVKIAMDSLRMAANAAGLKGVTIGICLGPGKGETSTAEDCGFDVLTGYNYSPIGFVKGLQTANTIQNLQSAEPPIWNRFHSVSTLPCIPLVTLNYDPRPWRTGKAGYSYYQGYSGNSVRNSVTNVINWVNNNPQSVTKEKLVILYAWNEYGEGAWLTPSAALGTQLLDGLRSAIFNGVARR